MTDNETQLLRGIVSRYGYRAVLASVHRIGGNGAAPGTDRPSDFSPSCEGEKQEGHSPTVDCGWAQRLRDDVQWDGSWARELRDGERIEAAAVLSQHGPISRPAWRLRVCVAERVVFEASELCRQSPPPFSAADSVLANVAAFAAALARVRP